MVIAVGVVVAAGIAAYENPQIREWVDNSRRKIAVALHSLGDEVNPSPRRSSAREDISMTEAVGDEAEERRRKAKDDLNRRREMILMRKKKENGGSVGSFDALVDEEGRLKDSVDITEPEETRASATAVDTGEGNNLIRRRFDASRASSDFPSEDPSAANPRSLREGMNGDRMHIALPSETSSNHPSESLVDLTPTSEFPGTQPVSPISHSSDPQKGHQEPMAQSEYFSLAESTSTNSESASSGFYYAHPHGADQSNTGPQSNVSPFADPLTHENLQDVSSTPSVAGSMGYTQNQTGVTSSDGTLSDFGYPTDGIRTPASWSEVGSVVSGDDTGHY